VAFATDIDRSDRSGAWRHPYLRHHLPVDRWWTRLPDDDLGFAAHTTSLVPTDIGRGNAWAYTVAILTLVIAIFYMKLLYGRGDVRS
jgi:hypothetical protein